MNIDALCAELEARGLDWANKNAAADALELSRPIVRARLQKQFIADGSTFSKADAWASSDPSYEEHVGKLHDANRAAARARVLYETIKTRIELLRTQSANDRAAMNLK